MLLFVYHVCIDQLLFVLLQLIISVEKLNE